MRNKLESNKEKKQTLARDIKNLKQEFGNNEVGLLKIHYVSGRCASTLVIVL